MLLDRIAMSALALHIAHWFALNDDCVSRAQWRRYLHQAGAASQSLQPDIEAATLPANMRRRMSSLTKRALQCSLTLAEEAGELDYGVFASRHGELPRTAKLIEQLVAGDDVSPMGFAQSVHNTGAGLHTIISDQALPVTSVAAGDQTFSQAWLECYIYLEQNPSHTVLLQYFDEPVPDIFKATCQQPQQALSLGLILGSAAGPSELLIYNSDDDLLSLLGQIVNADSTAKGGNFALTCY
jgi:hypothetical protein